MDRLKLVGSNCGQGIIIIASPSTPSANEPAKDLILDHTAQLKPMIKAQISGRMASSSISGVVTASVNLEKTLLKKRLSLAIIIMNKSQETTVFHGRQKLTFATKLRPEK